LFFSFLSFFPQLDDGYSCLHTAVSAGDLPCSRFLVETGRNSGSSNFSIDLRDINGNTPLHLAIIAGSVPLVKYLMEQGANADLANKNQETGLHHAARKATSSLLLYLPVTPVNVNLHDVNGNTPLLNACVFGNTDAAAHLLAGGANVDCADNSRLTPLMAVAQNGHAALAEELFRRGCSTNKMDKQGNQALHWAALTNNVTLLRALFERHLAADRKNQRQTFWFSEPNNRGDTALHLAVREGHLEAVELFLNKPQLASFVAAALPDLLELATARGHHSLAERLTSHRDLITAAEPATAEVLEPSPPASIASEDSTDSRASHESTPSSLPLSSLSASPSTSSTSSVASKESRRRLLLPPNSSSSSSSSSSSPSSPSIEVDHEPTSDPSIETPLSHFWSSSPGSDSESLSAHLRSPPPSCDERPSDLGDYMEQQFKTGGREALLGMDSQGLSFVHTAAVAGDVSALTYLFSKCHDSPASAQLLANMQILRGNTPAHFAVQHQNRRGSEILSILLSFGADLRLANEFRETPLHVCASSGSSALSFLLKASGNLGLLNRRDNNGNTPLMAACLSNQPIAVRLLKEAGASTEIPDTLGVTALMAATRQGFSAITTFLVESKPNWEVVDLQGNSVLHWAAATNNLEMVQHYLRHSRKISARNDGNCRRETALFLACREGHVEVVRRLVTAKIDQSITDSRGRTCGDVAKTDEIRALLRPSTSTPLAATAPTTSGDE